MQIRTFKNKNHNQEGPHSTVPAPVKVRKTTLKKTQYFKYRMDPREILQCLVGEWNNTYHNIYLL